MLSIDKCSIISEIGVNHWISASKRYWYEEVGYNYRLKNILASIGCAQLEQFHSFRSKRSKIFSTYDEILLPTRKFTRPLIKNGDFENYWLYTVLIKTIVDMDLIAEKLREKGIDSRPIFFPMNHMPAFSNLKFSVR